MALLGVTVLVAGCGIGSADDKQTLTVLAASSLTDTFGELGKTYKLSHPGVSVRFSFAGSQELAMQVKQGSRADVLATADEKTMTDLKSRVSNRRVFARNSLAIAVAPGNPRNIRGLADLTRPKLRVILAAPNVPVGRYARQSLATAGVRLQPKSEEVDVRTVLTRVRTGEADAGIVYATDLQSAGAAAATVPIPPEHNVAASYPAATIKDSKHGDAAKKFVAWLSSAEARTVLVKYGFATP